MRVPTSAVSRKPERPLEVDVDDGVEQLLADLVQPVVDGRDPGVVDENVELAELFVCVVDKTVELIPASDVHAVDLGAATGGLPHLGGHLFTGLDLAAGDQHIRPSLGEGQHHLPAQALAASGDERSLAREVE